MKCRVDRLKFIGSLITAGGGMAAAFVCFYLNYWVAGFCFMVIAGVYSVMSDHLGAVISIGPAGVQKRYLSGRTRDMEWTEVKEVGIIGLKVLKKRDSMKTGSMYIYLSAEEMTEEVRFDMALRWPPRDVMYFKFSFSLIRNVQQYWKNDVILYNTGALHLDRKADQVI